MTASTSGTVGDGGFVPLTVEEARALMTQAPTGADRDALLAERAEAEAQLRAAEATLGLTPPAAGNGQGDGEQERDEPAQNPHDVDVHEDVDGWLDVDALREAAAGARAADDELARAASEAAERPPPSGPLAASAPERLGSAESAFARALELREELPAAWRRLVGALISATGMAIVIGALGWNAYWLLVPIALIAIMTVDLRLAGKAAREASAEAAGELTAVGVAGSDVLEHMRRQREETDEAEARLAAARAERDAAYDRFEELAPGRLPSEVEEVIAEYEAELAEKREAADARAEAEAAARAEADAAAEAEAAPAQTEAAVAETEAARAETAPQVDAETTPATAPDTEAPDTEAPESEAPESEAPESEAVEKAEEAVSAVSAPAAAAAAATEGDKPVAAEWWFGSKEPPPVPAAAAGSVRALAERLSAEGREALARVEAQLAALDRVELARRSLEWHQQNGSTEPASEPPAGTA